MFPYLVFFIISSRGMKLATSCQDEPIPQNSTGLDPRVYAAATLFTVPKSHVPALLAISEDLSESPAAFTVTYRRRSIEVQPCVVSVVTSYVQHHWAMPFETLISIGRIHESDTIHALVRNCSAQSLQPDRSRWLLPKHKGIRSPCFVLPFLTLYPEMSRPDHHIPPSFVIRQCTPSGLYEGNNRFSVKETSLFY